MNTLKKIAFYTLLLSNNILAIGLIGIAFLSGPGYSAEAPVKLSETSLFVRLVAYATIVGLVFAGISFLLGFVFRKTLGLSGKALAYIAIIEFLFLLVTFFAINFVVYHT